MLPCSNERIAVTTISRIGLQGSVAPLGSNPGVVTLCRLGSAAQGCKSQEEGQPTMLEKDLRINATPKQIVQAVVKGGGPRREPK